MVYLREFDSPLAKLAEATARHLWDADPERYLETGYDDVWDLVREVKQTLVAMQEVIAANPGQLQLLGDLGSRLVVHQPQVPERG